MKIGSNSAHKFYQAHKEKIPNIYEIAARIFCMRPSSSSVESCFTVAALSSGSGNRRVNLSQLNMENETILKCNIDLIDD